MQSPRASDRIKYENKVEFAACEGARASISIPPRLSTFRSSACTSKRQPSCLYVLDLL